MTLISITPGEADLATQSAVCGIRRGAPAADTEKRGRAVCPRAMSWCRPLLPVGAPVLLCADSRGNRCSSRNGTWGQETN